MPGSARCNSALSLFVFIIIIIVRYIFKLVNVNLYNSWHDHKLFPTDAVYKMVFQLLKAKKAIDELLSFLFVFVCIFYICYYVKFQQANTNSQPLIYTCSTWWCLKTTYKCLHMKGLFHKCTWITKQSILFNNLKYIQSNA